MQLFLRKPQLQQHSKIPREQLKTRQTKRRNRRIKPKRLRTRRRKSSQFNRKTTQIKPRNRRMITRWHRTKQLRARQLQRRNQHRLQPPSVLQQQLLSVLQQSHQRPRIVVRLIRHSQHPAVHAVKSEALAPPPMSPTSEGGWVRAAGPTIQCPRTFLRLLTVRCLFPFFPYLPTDR